MNRREIIYLAVNFKIDRTWTETKENVNLMLFTLVKYYINYLIQDRNFLWVTSNVVVKFVFETFNLLDELHNNQSDIKQKNNLSRSLLTRSLVTDISQTSIFSNALTI